MYAEVANLGHPSSYPSGGLVWGGNDKGRDCSRPLWFNDAELLGCHFFGFAFLPHQLQLALGFLEGCRHFLLHAGSGFFEFLR
jgi:hypothetical protein